MPHSRPMPSIGQRCHELRIPDENVTWRIIYRTDSDAIVIGEVFPKKTNTTPEKVIDTCKRRFKAYDKACEEKSKKSKARKKGKKSSKRGRK